MTSHASTISGRRTFIFRSNTFILASSFLYFLDSYFSSFFSFLSVLEKASASSSLSSLFSSFCFLLSLPFGVTVAKCSNTCLNSAICFISQLKLPYPVICAYQAFIHADIFNFELGHTVLLIASCCLILISIFKHGRSFGSRD